MADAGQRNGLLFVAGLPRAQLPLRWLRPDCLLRGRLHLGRCAENEKDRASLWRVRAAACVAGTAIEVAGTMAQRRAFSRAVEGRISHSAAERPSGAGLSGLLDGHSGRCALSAVS